MVLLLLWLSCVVTCCACGVITRGFQTCNSIAMSQPAPIRTGNSTVGGVLWKWALNCVAPAGDKAGGSRHAVAIVAAAGW